jgi:anion-transporting  ArsA/GET3 family ATPase
MTELLGGRMFRWLLRPYRAAGRVGARGAGLGARALAATVGRIAGGELLSDTADFLGAFEGMYEGFRERAGRVVELLGDDATGFVVVSAPEPASLREAAAFLERVGSAGMSAAAVVVNRCRSAPPVEVPPAALEALERGSGEERAIAACVRATLRINQMQSRQHEAIMELRPAAGPSPILEVPELAPGLRGRRALEAVARSLFG